MSEGSLVERRDRMRLANPSRRTFRKGREPFPWDFSFATEDGTRDNFSTTSITFYSRQRSKKRLLERLELTKRARSFAMPAHPAKVAARCSSNTAKDQKDNQNDDHKTQSAARVVAPTAAVWPSGQTAKGKQNQNDQQN
jgi:hypothetical protein